uniref:interferon gamma receptor 1 n=1 Tax=Scatophagus argus TaxID=75038 RepID=UPI001ED82AA3|nr:interferon gamma receptor 1 [Scatophagus argus]
MRLLRDGAFTALLLLVSGASALAVRPPTNVTVGCQNTKVIVSWEYSTQQPETSFKVFLIGANGQHENETSDRQFDLSRFVWSSEDHYMDNFFVAVTARQGNKQSEPAQSKTFSFNNMKTVDTTCRLDFPPVNLKLKESQATVNFTNPSYFYRELKEAEKSGAACFSFSIIWDGGEKEFCCKVTEENCRRDVVLPEGVNCVTLGGTLFDSIGVGQVLFRQTEKICPKPSSGGHGLTLIILLSIMALLVSVAIVLIWKVKAWTMRSEPLPKFLPSPPSDERQTYKIKPTVYSRVVVIPPSRSSVSSEDEGTHPTKTNPTHSSSQELRSISEDDSEDSEKTECLSMYLEEREQEQQQEQEVLAYDRPHLIQVDMGDGDTATAYTSR